MSPTNHYFNNYPGDQVTSEQNLIEDILIESLRIYGMDCYYLPRESRDQIDRLMGEEQLKTFTSAYTLEMYVESATGMEGAGDLISKFGLSIEDEMTLLVSRRRFKFVLPHLTRPREGDLVYVPLLQNFFEVTFVEHENSPSNFYTLGKGRWGNVYLYALKLKQFVFSNEVIQVGTDEVDEQILESYQLTDLVLSPGGTGTFDVANNELVYQGASFATANAFGTAHTWNDANSTLSIALVNGQFVAAANVKGQNSGATWIMSTLDTNTPLEMQFEDIGDNKQLESESNALLDFSTQNPFGEP